MAKTYHDEIGEYEIRPGKYYGSFYRHYLNGEKQEKELNKNKSKLTDEELKKEIGNDVTILQKYAKEEGILPSELQDRLGITDRDLGLEDEYTKEFERDMQEKARYVMAEEAKKSPKTPSQDNTTSKKELEHWDNETLHDLVIAEKRGNAFTKESDDYKKLQDKYGKDFIDKKFNDLNENYEIDPNAYVHDDGYAETVLRKKPNKLTNDKKSSQDDIDNTYFNNYKKDQERLDQAREKMSKPIEKEGSSRSYNKQSYIEAKSQVDREMRRDGDLSDDEYLNKLVDKYTDIENRSPQDYDMKKVLREVKEDALKAREEQRQNEKENLLSGIPQRKEIFPNEYLARDYKKLQNDSQIGNKERWSQAYEDEVKEYGKQLKQENTNDKYKEYYKKENLGTPSNYKPGDEIEFDTGYYSKLKGKVIREANDKDKRYQMNMNVKGYVVRDENGFESIVPDTRILNREKMVEKTNKAYKDNKPIIDSNKKTTNDYMNDKIRNNRKKSEDQIAREQLEKYKDKLKDPTKSKVTKADIKKGIFKK